MIQYSNPTIWSARLRKYLDTLAIYVMALTNRDYEGEVKFNGTVKILGVGDVSVEDHDGAWDDSEWGDLSDDELELTIDQNKRFKFKVPDQVQNGSILRLIDLGSQRAAYAVNDTVDQFIGSKHSQVDAANLFGDSTTPIVVGFDALAGEVSPVNALIRQREVLAISKAPAISPNVVIPIWMGTMLLQEIGARATGMGDAAIRAQGVEAPKQGLIAQNIAGWSNIYTSANVPNTAGAKYKVIGGDKHITFAEAINTVKTVDLQNDFAMGVKGHFIYGAKLLQGKLMSCGTYDKGTYKEQS